MRTPQKTAAAAAGVGCRSRSRCRSHRPTSSRSLSRKRTVSELNWSTAQRTARTQAVKVTPSTTGRYRNACQYDPSIMSRSKSTRPVTGIRAVSQGQLHARRHGQHGQRHRHQEQGDEVVLSLAGAAGQGGQGQAQRAVEGRDRHQRQGQPERGQRRGRPEFRRMPQDQPTRHPHAHQVQHRGGHAEDHHGEQLAQHDLAPLGGAAQQGLQRAALLLAGAEVHGRIEGPGHGPDQQHHRQDLRPQGRPVIGGVLGDVRALQLERPGGGHRHAAGDQVALAQLRRATAPARRRGGCGRRASARWPWCR